MFGESPTSPGRFFFFFSAKRDILCPPQTIKYFFSNQSFGHLIKKSKICQITVQKFLFCTWVVHCYTTYSCRLVFKYVERRCTWHAFTHDCTFGRFPIAESRSHKLIFFTRKGKYLFKFTCYFPFHWRQALRVFFKRRQAHKNAYIFFSEMNQSHTFEINALRLFSKSLSGYTQIKRSLWILHFFKYSAVCARWFLRDILECNRPDEQHFDVMLFIMIFSSNFSVCGELESFWYDHPKLQRTASSCRSHAVPFQCLSRTGILR